MSYLEKGFYDYIKKVLTDGIKILLSRKFIFFSLLFLAVSLGTSILSYFYYAGSTDVVITDEILSLIFTIQIAVGLSFIIFGIFSKKIKKFSLRITSVLIIFSVTLLAFIIINTMPALQELENLLVQGLPIIFMLLWCIIIPIASFSFIKNMFYSKFTGTILFLGKPDEDRNSLFVGPVVICALVGFILGFLLLSNDDQIIQNLGTISGIVSVMTILTSIVVFLLATGKLTKNYVFSSTLSFYFILSLPNLIMLYWGVLSSNARTISEWNYLILAFSLIYSAQGVFRRSDVLDLEEKYPDYATMSKKERKKLEKQEAKDDPYMISKIVRFIGSEGLVLILLGSFLGYHLLQLQLYTGFYDDMLTSITGNQHVSILYQGTQVIVTTVIIFLLAITYMIFKRTRTYFEPVHMKLGFLPPYDQLKETLEKLKTGEIDWKAFAAVNTLKLASAGIKAGAKGTVKTGASVISSFGRLLKRDEDE